MIAMFDRDWIKTANEHDADALAAGIKWLFNVDEVSVDDEGDVWIAGPGPGRWLDADGLSRIARHLAAGDI